MTKADNNLEFHLFLSKIDTPCHVPEDRGLHHLDSRPVEVLKNYKSLQPPEFLKGPTLVHYMKY